MIGDRFVSEKMSTEFTGTLSRLECVRCGFEPGLPDQTSRVASGLVLCCVSL